MSGRVQAPAGQLPADLAPPEGVPADLPRRRSAALWPEPVPPASWDQGLADAAAKAAQPVEPGQPPLPAPQPARYRRALSAARAELASVEAGAAPEGRVDREALVLPPLPHARVRPVPLGEGLRSAELARMALDHDPSLGEEAALALLGPWVQVLRRAAPAHRRALRSAAALAALAVAPRDDKTPARALLRARRGVPAEALPLLQAALRAPVVPFRLVEARAGSPAALPTEAPPAEGSPGPDPAPALAAEPVVPVDAWWVPEGPLELSEAGWVSAPPGPGSLLLARVVPAEAGPELLGALVLPEVPPARWWSGVLHRHALPERLLNRGLRHEELLARMGHQLVAEAHRWAWVRALA